MAIPTEFTGFVHDVAMRAFDTLADRVKELDSGLRPIVRAWSKLSRADKDQLIEELIASVQRSAADPDPEPVPKKRSAKKKKA